MVLAHYRDKGVGPAAPADQPTISAQTVSKETEISLVTLVTEFRLVFILLFAIRLENLEFFFIAVPFKISTLAKRSAIDNRRTLKNRSEEQTSELQSLMSITYTVICLKKKI